MADALGCVDGGVADAARFLATVLEGMGDTVELSVTGDRATLRHAGLRIVRGLEGVDRETMLACWTELWRGAIGSHRVFIDVEVEEVDGALIWQLAPRG